jgi:hypothetical protein
VSIFDVESLEEEGIMSYFGLAIRQRCYKIKLIPRSKSTDRHELLIPWREPTMGPRGLT